LIDYISIFREPKSAKIPQKNNLIFPFWDKFDGLGKCLERLKKGMISFLGNNFQKRKFDGLCKQFRKAQKSYNSKKKINIFFLGNAF
jgi:hypothetical protein